MTIDYNSLMVVVPDESGNEFAQQIARAMGKEEAEIVVGPLSKAAEVLANKDRGPSYIIIDVGDGYDDILDDLDELAEHCEPDVKVVVIGSVNDISFYRALTQRGILEYFAKPALVSEVRSVLMSAAAEGGSEESSVISFMSAASGDGSSTIAMNTAYALSKGLQQKVVLVDMDYQFGMIARNLDMEVQFGIREVFEYSDRVIDSTLIKKMLVEYSPGFHVISAPAELNMIPAIKPEMINSLVNTLKESFDYVILDVPHIWTPWVSTALNEANIVVMVAQLWLRSATHSSRLLSSWQDVGVDLESVVTTINRSGAKFKQALTTKDFERVCNKAVDFSFSNDIRITSMAEKRGETIFEVGRSKLANEFKEFAKYLYSIREEE